MAISINRRAFLRHTAVAGLAAGLAPLLANASEALRVWRYKGQAASFMADAGQASTPYPLQWVDVPGGAMVLEAFASNSLDYAFMSPVLPLFASAAGNPLVLIASYQGEQNRSSLIVPRARWPTGSDADWDRTTRCVRRCACVSSIQRTSPAPRPRALEECQSHEDGERSADWS